MAEELVRRGCTLISESMERQQRALANNPKRRMIHQHRIKLVVLAGCVSVTNTGGSHSKRTISRFSFGFRRTHHPTAGSLEQRRSVSAGRADSTGA